jgi:hypothetical protein
MILLQIEADATFASDIRPDPFSVDDWISTLRASTKLGLQSARDLSIEKLAQCEIEPTLKISLAQELDVDEWVAPACGLLARRPTTLTMEEANRIGLATVVRIMRLRDESQSGLLKDEPSSQHTPYESGASPFFSSALGNDGGQKKTDDHRINREASHLPVDKGPSPGASELAPDEPSMCRPDGMPSIYTKPLEQSQDAWKPFSERRNAVQDGSDPTFVRRKVTALLNKLTNRNFDTISDRIIHWANRSENETNGETLLQVTRLVLDKAKDEATWSEMYARLCRKIMEQISSKVQDEGIRGPDGKPVAGAQLFRKYLLNGCQEDFERDWVQKDAAQAAATAKISQNEVDGKGNEGKFKKDVGLELFSDEYYAAQKIKRQSVGLVKFIGEVFKLRMLTERIMHGCVQKLVENIDNPEEYEIESLCKLLTTVGEMLDTSKASGHMDAYFQRMETISKSPTVKWRMRFLLQVSLLDSSHTQPC